MIKINSLDCEDLFSEQDKEVIESVVNLQITAREKWSHDDMKPILARVKDALLDKQRKTCFYCQRTLNEITKEDWQIDHIVSINEDDRHVFTSSNLVLSCKWCNRSKREGKVVAKIPSTKRYSMSSANYKIIHPRIDRYSDHMEILGRFYLGKPGKGKKQKKFAI